MTADRRSPVGLVKPPSRFVRARVSAHDVPRRGRPLAAEAWPPAVHSSATAIRQPTTIVMLKAIRNWGQAPELQTGLPMALRVVVPGASAA